MGYRDNNRNGYPKTIFDIERKFWNTFITKINERDFAEYRKLLKYWSESPDIEDRKKIFDVAAEHECQKIQEHAQNLLAISLSKYAEEYVELWMYRPVKSLRKVIRKLINNRKNTLNPDIKAAVLLLLNRMEDALEVDPEFAKLENKIRLEPLMLSHIDSHLTSINKQNFLRQLNSRTRKIPIQRNVNNEIIELPHKFDDSWRALRGDDLDVAWRNLLSSSFSCILNYIGLFIGHGWKPKLKTEREIFEILTELVGFGGWKENEDMLFLLFGSKTDLAQLGLKLKLNPEVYTTPSYFTRNDFDRNSFYFSTPFYDHLETYIVSLYFNQKEILQIEIPNVLLNRINQNKIQIENKIHTKDQLKLPEVDLVLSKSGIFTLIFPSIETGLFELKWSKSILKLLNKNSEELSLRMRGTINIILAIVKLLEYHGMKRFQIEKIVSKKIEEPIKEKTKNVDKIENSPVIIGLDFGNSTTALVILNLQTGKFVNPKEYLKEEFESSVIIKDTGIFLNSLIAYRSGGRKYIGKKAIKYCPQRTTFKEMKKSLRADCRNKIRVDGRDVLPPDATKDFLRELFDNLNLNKFNITKIAFAHPINAPSGYQILFKEFLSDLFKRKSEDFIFSIDEATASCISMKDKIKDSSGSIVTIDVGAGTTDVSVLMFEKIVKLETEAIIYGRDSIEKGGGDIDKEIFQFILEHIRNNKKLYGNNFYSKIIDDDECVTSLLLNCQEVKHKISDGKNLNHYLKVFNKEIKYALTKDLVNNLLGESFYNSFYSLVEGTINSAKNSGAPFPPNIVLFLGGGFQWKELQDVARKLFPKDAKIISEYKPFIVAKGTALASIGLNVKSELPYDIGIIRNHKNNEVFHKLLKKNITKIPMKLIFYKIKNNYSLSNILLEVCRYRRFLTDKDDSVLIYDNDNKPRIQSAVPIDYIEPLSDPIEFPTNKMLGFEINSMGEVLISEIDDSGKISKVRRIGRSI